MNLGLYTASEDFLTVVNRRSHKFALFVRPFSPQPARLAGLMSVMAMLRQLSGVFAVEIEQGFTPASHR